MFAEIATKRLNVDYTSATFIIVESVILCPCENNSMNSVHCDLMSYFAGAMVQSSRCMSNAVPCATCI